MSIPELLDVIDEPEIRSQKFNRLKRILKKVGIPGVLWIWKKQT